MPPCTTSSSPSPRGLGAHVDRLPDAEDSRLLATVTLSPGAGLPADPALQRAIEHRRTDRRRMSHRAVPSEHLRLLGEHAWLSGGEAECRGGQQDGIPEQPQLVLRLGWPASCAAEIPPTPRRRLHSVLLID